jgi:hypothetical protein
MTRPYGGDVLIVVVCDGAGSASLSHLGATATCSFIVARLEELLGDCGRVQDFTREVTTNLVLDAQSNLKGTAEAAGATTRDLACTLVTAVVGTDAAAFFQVGDGLTVVGPRNEPDDEFSWVFWPERGEYANTTSFLSDELVVERLQHAVVDHAIDEIAVLSDGIQSLVLNYREHAAHAPFFLRMLSPLRNNDSAGHIGPLSEALATYLDTDAINERTDDDKTLVLASRRAASAG